jgi:transcription-repair coupling factor (superfamily II helicase)
MKLAPLPEKSITPFEEAALFLARSRSNGGIYGLKGSAPHFLTAAALRQSSGTIVIVSPDGERASTTASDIRFYMGEEEFSGNSLEDKVLFYPSTDLQPYSAVAVETDVWIGRMAVLYRLCQGRAPRVISIGLDALIRMCCRAQLSCAPAFLCVWEMR